MKKYLEKLSILSLYYREGLVGAWIGFLLGLIVGTLIWQTVVFLMVLINHERSGVEENKNNLCYGLCITQS